jgi:hypothetical protein
MESAARAAAQGEEDEGAEIESASSQATAIAKFKRAAAAEGADAAAERVFTGDAKKAVIEFFKGLPVAQASYACHGDIQSLEDAKAIFVRVNERIEAAKKYVFILLDYCSSFFSCLRCLCLSLSYPSITPCLHSLTRHDV